MISQVDQAWLRPVLMNAYNLLRTAAFGIDPYAWVITPVMSNNWELLTDKKMFQ